MCKGRFPVTIRILTWDQGRTPEGSRRHISTWTPAEGADPELGLLNLGLGSTISNLRESIW